MAKSVEEIKGAVEYDDTIKISWRFKANVSQLLPEGIVLAAPGPVPLPGSWKLQVNSPKHTQDKLNVSVHYGDLPVGAFGKSVTVKLCFALGVGADQRRLHEESWSDGAEPSRALSKHHSYGTYSFAALRSKIAANNRWSTSEQSSILSTRGMRMSAYVFVRATRPVSSYGPPRDCSTASEYYETLFASGCAETVPSGSNIEAPNEPKAAEQTGPAEPTIDWQDSDDETDDFLVERDSPGNSTPKPDSIDVEYQQINVRETAYSTMRAVLLYLMTGHIEFAPLSSLLATLGQNHCGRRRDLFEKHPKMPLPVSPKSVYRLAHLLQQEDLQELALDALSSHLTIEGVARELFSPVSIAYPDVKKVVLDYVVKNWEEVQASESWTEMRENAMAGEIEGAAQVLFDLLSALHGKDSKQT